MRSAAHGRAQPRGPGRMTHICFVSIVRDEAPVIRRCLESIRPLADSVLIIDTGSEDDTAAIIRDWLDKTGIPGEVLHRPWHGFAHNRNELLDAARQRPGVDYLLTIDADETLIYHDGFDARAFRAGLTQDWYDIKTVHGAIEYPRAQLFSARLPFRYAGVLHSTLQAIRGMTRGRVTGFHTLYGTDGARSRDPQKFLKCAWLLEEKIDAETDPDMRRRHIFYLAQSWRDAGEHAKPLPRYLERAEMGGWVEEQYVALLEAAKARAHLDATPEALLGAFLRAHDRMPTRAEALFRAVFVCRQHGMPRLGYMLARQGLAIVKPDSGLFLEPAIYRWRMADEFHLAAWKSGAYEESLEAAQHLLSLPDLPEDARTRVAANEARLSDWLATRRKPKGGAAT